MKHENCKKCLVYDELIDGILTPCDDEKAWKQHYCTAYMSGIPDRIWKGKIACEKQIEKS